MCVKNGAHRPPGDIALGARHIAPQGDASCRSRTRPSTGLMIRADQPLSFLDHPRKPDPVIAGEITVKNRADGPYQHLTALGYGDAIA